MSAAKPTPKRLEHKDLEAELAIARRSLREKVHTNQCASRSVSTRSVECASAAKMASDTGKFKSMLNGNGALKPSDTAIIRVADVLSALDASAAKPASPARGY